MLRKRDIRCMYVSRPVKQFIVPCIIKRKGISTWYNDNPKICCKYIRKAGRSSNEIFNTGYLPKPNYLPHPVFVLFLDTLQKLINVFHRIRFLNFIDGTFYRIPVITQDLFCQHILSGFRKTVQDKEPFAMPPFIFNKIFHPGNTVTFHLYGSIQLRQFYFNHNNRPKPFTMLLFSIIFSPHIDDIKKQKAR